MIFLIAGNYDHARKWAEAHQLDSSEWVCTLDLDEIKKMSNFHVIILESASYLPSSFFEKLYNLAKFRGRINRR